MDDVTASIIIACQTAGAVTSINKLGFALRMLGKQAAEFSWQFAKESLGAFNATQDASWKFGKTFRDSMGTATQAVREFMSEYNLSEQTAKTMLTDTAGVLKGFGFDEKEALKMSESVSRMGVDLASFTGHAGGAKDAVQAITAAMLGETERMKGYGTVIRMDDKELRELTKTMATNKGVTEDQARAMAILETIIKKNKDAIGDYKAEGENWTQAQNDQREAMIELKSAFGELIYGMFNIYPNTGSITEAIRGITSYIKKEGKAWAYALSSFWLDIREGVETVLVFLEPIWTGITAGFKNIANSGRWLYDNWGKIWDNMSDIAIAAGKDILNGILFVPKLIIKAFSEGFSAIGSMAVDQFKNIKDLFTGKIGFGDFYRKSFENVSSKFSEHIDHILTEGVKQFGELGKNTERALAQAGASPFPELATPDFSAWADPDKVLNRVKRESDARRQKLNERFAKWIERPEEKDRGGDGNKINSRNDFVVSMKKIADDIFRYRETTQSAILANSLEGIRLQSRQFINNSPQMQLVNQGKRTIALLEKVERSLTKMNQNGTSLTFRNA